MIKIQIHNVDEVETFLINLPKKIERELSATNQSFMSMVLEGARIRAPVDTGGLKESIKLEPVKRGKNVKKWKIVVGSPYALFQEEGFTPHSFFAGGTINTTQPSIGKTWYVSKWTPFMKPALQAQLSTFNEKLNNAMGRAIKK